MQVHSFTAQHAFINRVVRIAFYFNISLFILVNYNAAAYAAIAAGGSSPRPLKGRLGKVLC